MGKLAEDPGAPPWRAPLAPPWAAALAARIATDPARPLCGEELRSQGLDPRQVETWFLQQHGCSPDGYRLAWRIGQALRGLASGARAQEAAGRAGYGSEAQLLEALQGAIREDLDLEAAARLPRASWLPTPLGPMVAMATGRGLRLCEFVEHVEAVGAGVLRAHAGAVVVPGEGGVLPELGRQLCEYFAGQRRSFQLPLDLQGTSFQLTVWQELQRIPHGELRSYGELAEAIERPGASRAVGRANGSNRVALVVPCHRVVRASGELSGYAGRPWRKQRLLELEGSFVAGRRPACLQPGLF